MKHQLGLKNFTVAEVMYILGLLIKLDPKIVPYGQVDHCILEQNTVCLRQT
jgi:hypothetical protein